jgi:glycosyltransferase involved in cell wall biosynthesis
VKLIVQIPCLNEADALPSTLAELPRRVEGFDEVEWLLIDDGSTDSTLEVARGHGVDHVVRLTNNKGLAAAFQAGLDASLKLGADVIVNTDADNQYRAADIGRLVEPILAGQADMVVGDRGVRDLEHFSRSKRALQRLGSWVVRRASGTNVPDTTSGFRAYNREAALQLQVVSNFTYTLESLIQAGKMLVAIEHVPVGTNRTERGSRLFPSTWNYVRRNAVAIFRAYAMYEPLRVFTTAAVVLAIAALAAWTPFLADWILTGDSSGHIQSLILGAVLAIAAVQMFALGVVGDALAGQRVMAQRAFERIRRIELSLGVEPSHYERVGGGAQQGPKSNPAEPDAEEGEAKTHPAPDPAASGREAEQAAGRDSVATPAGGPE